MAGIADQDRPSRIILIPLLLLWFLLPLACLGQSLNDEFMFPGDEVWEEPDSSFAPKPVYSLGGILGSLIADGTAYTQLRLQPELAIWKVGLGLDLDLLIDGKGQLRKQDWDSWDDLLSRLLYLRFGDRSDSLYLRVGRIPDYTLGHGLIFDDYSNALRYPETKAIGGFFGINTNSYGLGLEVYTRDLRENDVIGARASAKPFRGTGIPLLGQLSLGVNLGADRNPQSKYPDQDKDGYPDIYDKFPADRSAWLDSDDDGIPDNRDIDLNGNSLLDHPSLNHYVEEVFPRIAEYYPDYPFDMEVWADSAASYSENRPIWVYSLEYELPLISGQQFKLSNYAEYAVMEDYGQGLILPGLVARLGAFEAKLELRNFSSRFLPAYFNNLYDEQRCQAVTALSPDGRSRQYYLTTKDAVLDGAKACLGWFGYLRGGLGKLGYLKVAYQDMYGDSLTTGKSLWGKLTLLPEGLPKLKEASIYYSQSDVQRIDLTNLRSTNAQLSGRFVYGLSDTYDFVLRYSEHYSDLNSDGKIRGRDETIESFNLGVEFEF